MNDPEVRIGPGSTRRRNDTGRGIPEPNPIEGVDFEPWRFLLRTGPVVECMPAWVDFDMIMPGPRARYAVFVSRKAAP